MKTLSHQDFTIDTLIDRDRSVSVIVPARNEAQGIGLTVERLMHLHLAGAIDQVLVADESEDETAHIASSLGAQVIRQSSIRPDLGPVLGKGDAMWRALHAATSDIIVFVDADSEDFGEHFIIGLAGAILTRPHLKFVKGTYRRPFKVGGTIAPEGGGRVTECLAKPLLRAYYPEIAFGQPLAGEIAATRDLLTRLPFVTDYGVDIALVLDAFEHVGASGMAQVDLGTRQNDHKTLAQLGHMADEVLRSFMSRTEPDLHPCTGPVVQRAALRRASASLAA